MPEDDGGKRIASSIQRALWDRKNDVTKQEVWSCLQNDPRRLDSDGTGDVLELDLLNAVKDRKFQAAPLVAGRKSSLVEGLFSLGR